jgi:fatty acid synthase subunit alpha
LLNRIATQDVFLKDYNVERFVEIGPADVLTGMLKKTVALHFKSQDAARHMKRRFLSYAQNAQEIQYLLEAAEAEAAPARKDAGQSATSPATQATPSAQATVKVLQTRDPSEVQVDITASAQVANAAPISDAPVDAKEILVAIIASKLRKSHSELATQQTIKALANGIFSFSV